MLRQFSLSLLLSCPVAAQAQDGPPPAAPAQPSLPEEIVVEAVQLPDPPLATAMGAQRLAPQLVRAVPRRSLDELVRLIGGAQQFRRSDSRSSNPTAQGLTLRALGGNAAARTLVLRDGVPVADPFFGSVPFTSILLDEVADVRVTRGAGAGPFGGGAVAGVVELASRDPRQAGGERTSLSVGSFATLATSGALGVAAPDGGIRLAWSAERSDGFATTPLQQLTPASIAAAYRHGAAELRGAFAAAGGRLDWRVGGFVDNRSLRFAGAGSRANGTDASVRWLRDSAAGLDTEALAWLQLRDFSTVTVSATSLRPVLDQFATPGLGWGARVELRPYLGQSATMRLGGDVRGAAGETRENVLAPGGAVTLRRRAGGQSTLAGVYAEQDVRLGPLVLGGGIRMDRWVLGQGYLRESSGTGVPLTDVQTPARTRSLWTARGGAALPFAPGWQARMAAYTGFRVPTLNELYRPFTVFPVTTRANAALTPERLTGAELALEYQAAPHFRASLTLFENHLSGAITNRTIGPNLRQRFNLPGIRVRGIEWDGQVRLRQIATLYFTGAYTDAVVDGGALAPALNGLRPAQTPRWSASATLLARGPAQSELFVQAYHGARQFEDDLNQDVLGAATILNAGIRIPLAQRLSVALSAENLTDSAVLTRNSAGSIDLGAPRSFRLTLRVE